jgi:hypothetical protein
MLLTVTKEEREAFLPTFMWPSSALRKMVMGRSWFRSGTLASREARPESLRVGRRERESCPSARADSVCAYKRKRCRISTSGWRARSSRSKRQVLNAIGAPSRAVIWAPSWATDTSKARGTWSGTCLFVCGQSDGSPSTTQSNTSHGEWQPGQPRIAHDGRARGRSLGRRWMRALGGRANEPHSILDSAS